MNTRNRCKKHNIKKVGFQKLGKTGTFINFDKQVLKAERKLRKARKASKKL